ALFTNDRAGFVERWLIADELLRPAKAERPTEVPSGDHRMGRRGFVSLGCAACHFLPDSDRALQPNAGQTAFTGLQDRFPGEELATFLRDPQARYPDGRMPRLPFPPETSRDLAAFLLLWSKPAQVDASASPPTPSEVNAVARRLNVRGTAVG